METILPASAYFDSAHPPVTGLPHLITALDGELLGKIGHLTKSKLGVWPVPAPADEQDVYDRARETAPFSAWALPANQAEILSFGPFIQEAIFGTKLMFLDAAFDETALARLAVVTGQRIETGAYMTRGFEDLPELPQLVEQCQWVLIPVGPEHCKALFIASNANPLWIAKLVEWCEREGRNVARLRSRDGIVEVADHPAPEKYRSNAIHHTIDAFLGNMEMFFGGADETILPEVAERIRYRRRLRDEIARRNQPPPS